MPTRYTVITTQPADDQLARLWAQADPADRRSLTQASDRIDLELLVDPDIKGTPLPAISPTLRFLEVSPLRAYYEVSEPDRLVQIIDYEYIP